MELHVYDFDDTLFRSPGPPTDWEETEIKWWVDPISLEPPHVPERPGPEWWHVDIVASALRSTQDTNVYAVLMTGRPDRFFRYRIPELLHQQNLDFDEVHLNPRVRTMEWKRGRILGWVGRLEITNVLIWEDQEELLEAYLHALAELSVPSIGYHVEG